MRTPRSLVPPLAAALLAAAAARPSTAPAQPAAAPTTSRPVVRSAAPTRDGVTRPVATYRFAGARGTGLPHRVTLADSAGSLVARLHLHGDRAGQPMLVTLLAADLVLQGQTPDGVLTLRLRGQNDPAASGSVGGRWWLGARQGELRGRVVR